MKTFIKKSAAVLLVVIMAVLLFVPQVSAAMNYQLYGFTFNYINSSTATIIDYDDRSADMVIPSTLLNKKIVSISNEAFRGDTQITSVDFSQAVYLTKIGMYAFDGCSSISQGIVLPDSLTELMYCAFQNCSSLPSVVLNDNLKTVPKWCFLGCTSLSRVTLNDGLETIEPAAFSGCTSLEYLEIPRSVTSIEDNSFLNCGNLTLGVYKDSYALSYAVNNGIDYIILDDEGHSYSGPEWSWADDYKSATATFSCAVCGDIQTIQTTDIVNDYRADKTVYTAYVTFNGTEYSDYVEGEAKLFAGHSITLEGDVGVNYFINVSEEDVDNGVTVDFEWTVAGVVKSSSYTINKTKDYVGDHLYKASCYVAAAEMTYNITASVRIANVVQQETNIYTVKKYTDTILNSQRFIDKYISSYGQGKYDTLNTLVKSLLDYGTRAQIRFDRTEPGLANDGTYYLNYEVSEADIDAPEDDMRINLSEYGLEYVGSTVVYLSKTTLRHYYRIANNDVFKNYKDGIKMDGASISYSSKDDVIYFDVKNIGAYDMDVTHTLSIGSNDYRYSVLTYIKKAINPQISSTDNTRELSKAAYRYFAASEDYFI